MRAAPLRVLVVGALTRTGQQVVRSLAARRDDFSVTALCGREMGALIADDTGALADAGMGVRFLEDGDTATADAVVIATDDPPPEASLQCLLESCSRQGVAQTVLLSRIGASKGALGLGRWKDAEECALAQAACNRMYPRLQPYVSSLQPYLSGLRTAPLLGARRGYTYHGYTHHGYTHHGYMLTMVILLLTMAEHGGADDPPMRPAAHRRTVLRAGPRLDRQGQRAASGHVPRCGGGA